MARPQKQGLDYFPLDVDFFSDRKIKRLQAQFGTKGIAVYLYILCEIYHGKGYYVAYDNDLVLAIADDVGISENATREIVNFLLSRHLLDEMLAQSEKVLSSKSVQRRFQEAKKRGKREVMVEDRYWLLDAEETCTSIQVRPHDNTARNNPHSSRNNRNFSQKNNPKERKEKEMKEEKRKQQGGAENMPPTPPALSEIQAYAKEIHAAADPERFFLHYQTNGWHSAQGNPIWDWKAKFRLWDAQDKQKAAQNVPAAPKVPRSENAAAYESFIYNFD